MSFKELFELDDRTYDRLKYIVLIVMPAVATNAGRAGDRRGIRRGRSR